MAESFVEGKVNEKFRARKWNSITGRVVGLQLIGTKWCQIS